MATGVFKHKLNYDWKISSELADKVCEEMQELCAIISEEKDGRRVNVREIERIKFYRYGDIPYSDVINTQGSILADDSFLVFVEVLIEPYASNNNGTGAWGYATLFFPFSRISTESSAYMVFMLKLLEKV